MHQHVVVELAIVIKEPEHFDLNRPCGWVPNDQITSLTLPLGVSGLVGNIGVIGWLQARHYLIAGAERVARPVEELSLW